MLEVERLGEPLEQPLAAAEDHGRDDDGQLVGVPLGQRLADEVRRYDDLAGRNSSRRGARPFQAAS